LARKQAAEAVREKPLLKQAERKLSRPRHKARSEMAFLEVPNFSSRIEGEPGNTGSQ